MRELLFGGEEEGVDVGDEWLRADTGTSVCAEYPNVVEVEGLIGGAA